ncbi:hypothetical protein RKD19_000194 [Streptomyces canus]
MFASSCTTRPRFSSRNSFYSLTGVSARLLCKGCDAHVRRYLWGTVLVRLLLRRKLRRGTLPA